jgi:[ribosomal protein S5]-alanine N-acetyltransferase
MTVTQTPRLLLRELTPADVDALLEVFADPVAMEHYPATKDRDETAAWIEWAISSYATNGFGLWAIVRRDDGLFLGDCGPMIQEIEGRRLPEIGYHLVRRSWGRGYATEAARACREWVFRETAWDEVCSIVSPENLASRRVAERVHARMRLAIWEPAGREVCLYLTSRGEPTSDTAPPG